MTEPVGEPAFEVLEDPTKIAAEVEAAMDYVRASVDAGADPRVAAATLVAQLRPGLVAAIAVAALVTATAPRPTRDGPTH